MGRIALHPILTVPLTNSDRFLVGIPGGVNDTEAMRTLLVCWILVAALPAQDGPRERPGFGRGPGLGFMALDTDHDGTISAKEIANAPESLRKLDKNGDGQITEEEVRPPRPPERETAGPGPDELVETLMAFDKNHDGKLSKDELPERMQGTFERGDTNKDGFLTADEIRVMAKAQAAPRARDGEERRRPEGGPGRGGMMMRSDPIFAALDTDHDGVLSANEIRDAAKSLKALDKNNDGQITADEARPASGPRDGGPGRPQL